MKRVCLTCLAFALVTGVTTRVGAHTSAQSTGETPPQPFQTTAPETQSLPSGTTDQADAATTANFEEVGAALSRLEGSVQKLKDSSRLKDWTPVGAAILTAIVAIFSIHKSTRTTTLMTKETLAEKAREEERKAIRAQIDGFYAPFIQLRNSSRLLYREAFIPRRTQQERDQFSDKDGNFRTLIALVRGHNFTGADQLLLEQIVDIGQKTATLIYDKCGLVADAHLQQTLGRATAHFRLMQLAFKSPDRFDGSSLEFESFTFPAELDDQVQATLNTLNERLRLLTSSTV